MDLMVKKCNVKYLKTSVIKKSETICVGLFLLYWDLDYKLLESLTLRKPIQLWFKQKFDWDYYFTNVSRLSDDYKQTKAINKHFIKY